MKVRAKFKVTGIDLRPGSRRNPAVRDALTDEECREWRKVQAKADELGEPTHLPLTLPTVRLTPVMGGPDASPEDNRFWEASSPSGSAEITITNPDAAEFFELDKPYYLTFERAD